MADARSFDDLRRYWDEIARGEPAAPGALDPDLAATIRRLHELDEAPPPDPAYARRLRESLMHASTLPLPTPFPSQPNGRRIVGVDVGERFPLQRWPGREDRRFWPLLATAALIALTLAAGFAAIGGLLQHATRPDEPDGIPALIGTPAASPAAGVTEDTVVFDHVLDQIPADAMWAGIERATINPGAHWPQGSPQTTTGIGPMLYRVEQGVATVHAGGPIGLTRSGTTVETTVPGGTDIALHVGDVAFVPTNVLTDWRNETAKPLVILDAGVANPWGVPPPAGVDKTSPIDVDSLTMPAVPAALTVHRLTLAPGAALPGQPVAGLKLVGVEAGQLELIWAKPTAPTVMSGSLQLGAGGWEDINMSYAFAAGLRNAGTQPVTFFLMTVTPLGPAATPNPAPVASPMAALPLGVTSEPPIFQQRLDGIPADADCPTLERETVAPGGTWTMGSIPPAYRGPIVYRVESGSISVAANGDVQLTRAGAATSTVEPGASTTLAVGDRYFTPTDVITHWRNNGAAPAVVLYVGVVAPSTGVNGVNAVEDDVVSYCPLSKPVPTLFGTTSALVTVQRLTLAPGAVLPMRPSVDLTFLGVERGVVTVVWANGSAPATPTGTHDFDAGAVVHVNGVNVGTENYFAQTLRNAGTEPLSLLMLTVAPIGAEPGTPAA